MVQPKSLQQRLMLFLLLPVALLLFGMGYVGFFYAKNSLFSQWQEAAILKLQRAAHDVDMRLRRVKEWQQMYDNVGGEHYSHHINDWVLAHLREQEGVVGVKLTWKDQDARREESQLRHRKDQRQGFGQKMMGSKGPTMYFHRARIAEITQPRYDTILEHETVSIISELNDVNGREVGRLEVVIRFDYLVENLGAAGWWESNKAFLVDKTGRVLVCTDPDRHFLGDNDDPLELATLKAMQEQPSGTILGKGHPPIEVSGFYKLKEADWTIVLVAPGKRILAPIVRFRFYYFLIGAFFILFTLLLIRSVTGRTVSSIKNVSHAAESIASGDYTVSLAAKSQDEVGQLIGNFNTMVSQLQERMKLKEALNLAMEVQQSLLPKKPPKLEGFDVAGTSLYCDETGGDYYDFIELGEGRCGIAVGDVSGHGVSAALLMTTVRALLRSRAMQADGLARGITEVNRLLYADTFETGNFMTLFFMSINPTSGELQWVRAGHEPAMIYDPSTDSFEELLGDGIALGVDDTWSFQKQSHEGLSTGQIMLIGTDGIWETESPDRGIFGKDRLQEVIRNHHQRSSSEILQAVIDALDTYRQTAPQNDDVTLVVIKRSEE
jgi:sigma-B regulation protein RsbU (phosphoserine phosphatase)